MIEILNKEDEIKNPACECLEIMAEDILEGSCRKLFRKLESCLRESDDVECSAVSIFKLIIRITKSEKFDIEKATTFLDLNTTLPFNFH